MQFFFQSIHVGTPRTYNLDIVSTCLVEFREVKGKLSILVSSDSGVGHRDENRHHFSSSTGNRGCSIHEEIEVVHQQTTTIDNHLELKQFQKILGTYGRIVFLAPTMKDET